MKGGSPYTLSDEIAAVEAEERVCLAEIHDLEVEEGHLETQLRKAERQLHYYDAYLKEAASDLRVGKGGLRELLGRLRRPV